MNRFFRSASILLRLASNETPAFQLGGQALIEGVMLRSRRYVAAAVRRGDGTIELRLEPFQSVLQRHRWLAMPFLRGVVALFEMMGLGMRFLNWSSNVALQTGSVGASGPPQDNVPSAKTDVSGGEASSYAPAYGAAPSAATYGPPSSETTLARSPVTSSTPASDAPLPVWMFLLTLAFSLGFGLLLFVAAPYLIAAFLMRGAGENSFGFKLFEGVVKLAIFIGYLWIIGRRPNVQRVFEYHGAEHKVVYAAENKRPITPEGARPFDTPHPRCGTGFALLTVLVSVVCFALLPATDSRVTQLLMRLAFMPVIAGVSFEVLKATANPKWSRLASIILIPGMWLQRLTTRQPDDEQLEVGCTAMRALLQAEDDYPERVAPAARPGTV